MPDRTIRLEEYRDNSMGKDTRHFRIELENFNWREIRSLSDETLKKISGVRDAIESDLRNLHL